MKTSTRIAVAIAPCIASTLVSAAVFSLAALALDNRALAAGILVVAATTVMIVLFINGKHFAAGIVLSGAVIGVVAGVSIIDDIRTLSAEKVHVDSPDDVIGHPSARIFYLKNAVLGEEYQQSVLAFQLRSRKKTPGARGHSLFVPLVSVKWTPGVPVPVYVYTPLSADRARDLAFLRDTRLVLVEGPGDRHEREEQAREAAAAHKLATAEKFRVLTTSRDPVTIAKDSLCFNLVVVGIFLLVQCAVAARFALKRG